MELDIIKLRTTWNDAAGSINSNYAKIADAIAQLKANGGGGGGTADTVTWADVSNKPAWIIQAGNSKPKYSYDELTDTPDLSELATKTWVGSELSDYAKTEDIPTTVSQLTDSGDYLKKVSAETTYAKIASIQGFENRIGGLEGAVPQLNERVETVESKVATLNEYVVTGDNNLLNRVNVIEQEYATKTYVDNAIDGIDLSLYLLKADLTKSRIQSTLGISDWALASAAPTIKKERLTNFDSATPWTAFYTSFQASNRPAGANYFSGFTLSNIDFQGEDNTYLIQLALSHTGTLHTRYRVKGSFGAWRTLAFTSDIPTKLSQLTDDVVAGKYLSLSGGTLSNAAWRSQLTIERSGSTNDSVIAYSNSNGLLGCLGYRGADGIPCVWLGETGTGAPIIHANNIGSYNAGSATKLQTRRAIWGQGFDGTEDVSGSLDVSGNIKASGNINATSITINGVTITASNGSITVNGNVFATGDITGGV